MESLKIKDLYEELIEESKKTIVQKKDNEISYIKTNRFIEIEDYLIKNGSINFLIFLAETNLPELNYSAIGEKVANTTLSFKKKCNFIYGKKVIKADKKLHGKVIIDLGSAYDNYLYARDVEGADISIHSKVVLRLGDLDENIMFARDVKGADIKPHQKKVFDSKKAEYIFRFITEVSGADVQEGYRILKELNSKVYIDRCEDFMKNGIKKQPQKSFEELLKIAPKPKLYFNASKKKESNYFEFKF